MARQLIVVSRDDVGLYHALRADWAGNQNVGVILDRRLAQRRRHAVPTLERRRADRRQCAPVESVLAWRGGGAPARKSDIVSALDHASGSIAVRQRPGAKAAGRPKGDPARGAAALRAALSAPTTVAVAFIALIATLSGGIVSGLALWLFLASELALGATHGKSASRSGLESAPIPRWPQPLKKLLRAYRA